MFYCSGLDTTPAAVEQALSKEEFARALLLALRLNESDLIGRALDAIPPSSLPLIMQGVPSNRVERSVNASINFILNHSLAIHVRLMIKIFRC